MPPSRQSSDLLLRLPSSISLHILVSYLSPADICRISEVCRAWRQLTDNNVIWWPLCAMHAWQSDESESTTLAPTSFDPATMSKAARKLNWRTTWIGIQRSRKKYDLAVSSAAQARKYDLVYVHLLPCIGLLHDIRFSSEKPFEAIGNKRPPKAPQHTKR
jgi:hypothetical protein